MKRCGNCDEEIVYSGKGRPPSLFCSRKCKDAVRYKERRAGLLAERSERRCPVCDSVIPKSVTLKAVCCSPKCGTTYSNRVRAQRRRAEVSAEKRVCQRCGDPIPVDRHGATKYCSTLCKQRAHSAKWRERSPHYMRQYLYGLTPEDFERLLEQQDNRCAICGTAEWGSSGRWPGKPHVDHDHATGRVRGLLCGSCNYGLGAFRDDLERLHAAIQYLSRE